MEIQEVKPEDKIYQTSSDSSTYPSSTFQTNVEPKDIPKDVHKFDPSFIEKLKSMINRKKNSLKIDKKVRHNQIKLKKSKRRISNKNRKINQNKNRHNKFTK